VLVELVGKSLKGVFSLARNQGCIGFRSLTRRADDSLWRLRVELPPSKFGTPIIDGGFQILK